MTIRVFIPTTAAPAEVLSITEEDPEVDSVMCLGGRAVALRVSAEYAAFVRAPTGVIQRLFGHPSYRMDVSQPIDQGESFQFGALIAHAAQAEGRLARGGVPDRPGLVVWATGEVLRDLSVGPVGFVREKLLHSRHELAALRQSGWSVLLAVPAANRGEIDPALLHEIGVDGAGMRLVAPAHVAELDLPLDRPLPARLPGHGKAAEGGTRAPRRASWLGTALIGGAGTLVVGALAVAVGLVWPSVAGWQALHAAGRLAELERALDSAAGRGPLLPAAARGFAGYLEWQRPSVEGLELNVAALRPEAGRDCTGAAWPPAGPATATSEPPPADPGSAGTPVAPASAQGAAASAGLGWAEPATPVIAPVLPEATDVSEPPAPPPTLCGLALGARSTTPVWAMAELYRAGGEAVAGAWQGPAPRLSWEMTAAGEPPLRYRLVTLVPALGEAAPAALLPTPGADASAWDAAAARLARLGIALDLHEGVIAE